MKKRNENLIDLFQNLRRKSYIFFLNFLQSYAKNIFRNNLIDVSLRRIVDIS